MSSHLAFAGDLTIANGTATSNTLDLKRLGRKVIGLTLVGPSALTNVVKIRGSIEDETPQVLVTPEGTEVVVTAAKTVGFNVLGARKIVAVSAGNEAAERVIKVYAEFDL